ncbi:MAG: YigZ family protein [Micrococcaceae bacterium]
MSNTYRTFKDYEVYSYKLEVKRSVFIGYAKRVDSVVAANEFVQQVRAKHSDVSHACWGYAIGANQEIQRSTDDGEPGGTAGVPILQSILKNSGNGPLSDVISVVVRYFGGVLLGAGGLVRAYSEASAKTIAGALQTSRKLENIYKVTAPLASAGKVENQFRASGHVPIATDYSATAIELTVPLPDLSLVGQLQLSAELIDTQWVDEV